MSNIIRISLNKNVKDIYLLFWSIFLPLAVLIGLSYFNIGISDNTLFGILTISIFFYCCTTNSFSVFAQRKRGVFDLLTITPFSLWKYLSSITLSQTIIVCIVSTILVTIENSLFNIGMSVLQIVLFIPLFFLGSAIFTLLGFCLSAIPKNEGQLSITSNLVMIPLLLCSSVFLNLSNTPKLVQWISWINPVEWLQNGYRSVISSSLPSYLISIVVLLIFLAVFLVISKKSFQTKEK
ncbi:ABC transporter permease [Bacillus cereus group sp. N21]|uniref:ABC transporter permease n=1 Tax=Bacillus cereus group sp. N21 TaxID=2794591 RepID=UPI0018F4B6E1|nr:ABC transporter permease [Bacillus cereus group sp. N21]MBJ8031873.1 ABC transporter permease [Bacillus cereus group sp. N21]